MFESIKARIFPTLIALSALSVSLSAAFYSVTGLSKLFAGASIQVIIMAGSLEAAKLIIASLLYQYWDKFNKLLKFYLTIATVILVFITSAGIYGYLSAAYQETATQAGVVDKKIAVYELKKERFEENREIYLEEKKIIGKDIAELRKSLSSGTTIQYKDKETGQIITTTSRATRKAFEKQLDIALSDRDQVSQKLEAVTDSITKLDFKILEVESDADLASELGPLKYLSKLTGKDMDQIINWLLLIIIFVFDPLAIALVIAANFAFNTLRKKQKSEDEAPVELVERKAERVKAPTPEVVVSPPVVVEEEIEEELQDGEIKNIKGEYSMEKTEKPNIKIKPNNYLSENTLKGTSRNKKLEDINSRRVNKEEYLKAAKKTEEDDLKKKY